MKKFSVAVYGYGGRGKIYADNFHTLGIDVTAVCDIDEKRLKIAKSKYKSETYLNGEEFFQTKRADVLIIATLDDGHYEPCIRALRMGYDIILEKPISMVKAECEEIKKVADETGQSVTVCHVLRYAPFYKTVKKLLDSKEFGEIIHINLTEGVGYYHFAHSFVRGPWRNKKISAPVILAKSCHDMDMLTWLVEKKCLSVNSYGNLSFFRKEKAPTGATNHCVDCPHKNSCEYSCFKIYLNESYEKLAGLARHGRLGDSKEEIVKSLSNHKNLYGRCVFACDNDVFDHQAVTMQFENGIIGQFTLTAFTQKIGRTLHVYCEKGEIYGDAESKKVCYKIFGDHQEKYVECTYENEIYASHGGGDMGIVKDFMENYGKANMLSDIHLSMQSHEMGFAAEESALNDGQNVKLD
ncbi:MAG: Gfo/Idh/MocA family oxidoreductase [Clostridia bacterium]|nr:Gfo/Idh/MocA family oxidoreductase [Clostridia bacterium]